MTIDKAVNGTERTMTLSERLDAATAPQPETELKASIDGVEHLVPDFAAPEYLSSAGRRVLLSGRKITNRQGGMVMRNVNETIAEIFEVTGFCDVLPME